MPLTKTEFASGLVKDDTPLAAEGGYVNAENVRFRQGRPETRGGWELASTQQFTGIARSIKAWSDLKGQPQLAFGTADKLWVYTGGLLMDVTPPHSEGTLLNPFATTTGANANIVTVTHTEHALAQGQVITFSNATAVGGLTISGDYPVTQILSRNSYTITAASNATSAVTAGGASVDFRVATLPPGLVDGTGGLGFGTGGYGNGPYGLPSVNDFLPRVWSLDNFGEILLASPRGGALYAWQPSISYSEILTGTFVGGNSWAPTATGGNCPFAGTASNLSQNVKNAMFGGYVYRVTFDATVSAGSISFKVNAGSPTPAPIDLGMASIPITKTGTYSRLFVCPANPSDVLWSNDAQFVGEIKNASVKLEGKAFRITEAPARIDSMFVDPHRTVVLAGTYEVDGDYNPLVLRWSDLANLHAWIPDTTSFAGEISIASGGRIVAGLPSRTTNLIWTDAGLNFMAFSANGFSVGLIATGCGLIGRNAAAEYNGKVAWWSNSGNFYLTTFDYQGTVPQIIDCRIRADVVDHLAASQGEKVYASVNTEFSEFQWFYPDTRDGSDGTNGIECSRAAIFSLGENHWTAWSEKRSCWAPAGVFVSPIACGTDGYLYYHERGYTANGNPLPNFLKTAFFDIEDGGNFMQIMGIAHDFARRVGPVDFYISTKPFANGPETVSGPYTALIAPDGATYRDQKLDFRRTGRQMAIRMESTSPWRLGVLRAIAKKSGAVR